MSLKLAIVFDQRLLTAAETARMLSLWFDLLNAVDRLQQSKRISQHLNNWNNKL